MNLTPEGGPPLRVVPAKEYGFVMDEPRWQTDSCEQSEPAIIYVPGTAGSTLVAFSDFSLDLQRVPREYVEVPPGEPTVRLWRRPISTLGRSVFYDTGYSHFFYLGKIAPPKGWSGIWGRPSLAIDRNVVILGSLAISDASWNAATKGGDVFEGSPKQLTDGYCIATSVDGGFTFPSVTCFPWGPFARSNDYTSVAGATMSNVGGVYLAALESQSPKFTQPYVAVYHGFPGDPTSFKRLPHVPAHIPGHSFAPPKLFVNEFAAGAVSVAYHSMEWIDGLEVVGGTGGVFSGGFLPHLVIAPIAGPDLVHVSQVNRIHPHTWGYTYNIPTPGRIRPGRITLSDGRRSIMANSYDLAQYYDDYVPTRTVVYVARRADGREYLAQTIMVCSVPSGESFSTPFDCGWIEGQPPPRGRFEESDSRLIPLTEDSLGRQWMPSISVRRATVKVTYLTTEGAEEDKGEIHIVGDELNTAGLIHRDLTGLTSYCPRTNGYWGEQLASTTLYPEADHPVTMSAFSDSRPGCGFSGDIVSNPLHVSAAIW